MGINRMISCMHHIWINKQLLTLCHVTGTILGPGDILVENLVCKELTVIKAVKLWVGVWNCEGKDSGWSTAVHNVIWGKVSMFMVFRNLTGSSTDSDKSWEQWAWDFALCYKTHKDWKWFQHYQQRYNWPQYDKQEGHLLTETLTHEYMLSRRLWVADRIKFTYLSYNRCLIHLISIKTANKLSLYIFLMNSKYKCCPRIEISYKCD